MYPNVDSSKIRESFSGWEYQFKNYFRRVGIWTLQWAPPAILSFGIMKWCKDTYRDECWKESKEYNVKEWVVLFSDNETDYPYPDFDPH